eukprot:551019_1
MEQAVGIVILWGWRPTRYIIKISVALGKCTNNTAELYAAGTAFHFLKKDAQAVDHTIRLNKGVPHTKMPLYFFTDSKWTLGVLFEQWNVQSNPDLVAWSRNEVTYNGSFHVPITPYYTKGHSDIILNNVADNLANIGSDGSELKHYTMVSRNDVFALNTNPMLGRDVSTVEMYRHNNPTNQPSFASVKPQLAPFGNTTTNEFINRQCIKCQNRFDVSEYPFNHSAVDKYMSQWQCKQCERNTKNTIKSMKNKEKTVVKSAEMTTFECVEPQCNVSNKRWFGRAAFTWWQNQCDRENEAVL